MNETWNIRMKYLSILLTTMFLTSNIAYATGINHAQYYDKGLIYSGTTFPNSVAKSENIQNNTTIKNLKDLKSGESTSNNILNIVETGDASIDAAAKNGNIKKIYYVDQKIDKMYIPILFIPIYVKQKKTIVYGE